MHLISDVTDGDLSQNRSVMLGGKFQGWLPDVAVIMWRRMLGALGDPNEVRNPQIHAAIFDYLVELGSILIKVNASPMFYQFNYLIVVCNYRYYTRILKCF